MKLPFLSRFFSSSSKTETASSEDSGAAENFDAHDSAADRQVDAGPEIDIESEVDRLFDDSSLAHGDPPRAVILMGSIATGKTTMRSKEYSRGFVLIDAAEMFHHMSRDNVFLDFPDAFLEPLATIGPIIARRAVAERRHIVTEIVGADYTLVDNLLSALQSAGYTVEVVDVMCDLEEALRRNENRGDNVSAYHAEQFQRQWIIDACRQWIASPDTRPQSGSPAHTNSIDMEFVMIPAGSFMMGSADDDKDAWSVEKPAHKVTISKPFYLGKYEVTQAQWEAVMGNTPSRFKGRTNPVEQISWNDAQAFIYRLNKQEGHSRYRLPTEAEWEYAARAGSTSAYCFGDDAGQLKQYAWYDENSRSTYPVGQKAPNAWDLYDMHGNVREWVQDWYGEGYYSRSPRTDPQGPSSGSSRVPGRVLRGGSWCVVARGCRSACRSGITPDLRDDSVGFRLALSPE
jgi:formylglycine-generating enzyme required for sulfatase activity